MGNETIPTLYHYCSVEAFFNIITNKTIRLSDLNQTNDYLEGKWGRDKIYKIYKEITNEEITRELHIEFIANHSGAYAACFSEEADLLSQWRGYAEDGRGIAIGVDLQQLGIKKQYPWNSSIKEDSLGCEKIIYDEDVQERMINQFLRSYVLNESNKKANQMVMIAAGKWTHFFKNPAFQEEKEWRIVYRDALYKQIFDRSLAELEHLGPVKFRSSGDIITGFHDYSFENTLQKQTKRPITEIVLGPKCKLEVNYLEYFLYSNGFDVKKIMIKKSRASYR